ncbi:MAG TPA: hypothetical protein VF814_01175 [Casimicrobiaceae bacterium]
MNRDRALAACRQVRALQLLMIVGVAWAAEASADTYVILSLIGDHVTIVGQGSQVGSHLDQNQSEVVPLVESQLDDFAVSVADATIAKARPDAGVVTLRASDPTLYKLRDSWLDAELTDIQDLISLVRKRLPPLPDGHLLLITPYRDQPELRTGRDERGSGKVSGLGFYLDAVTRMRRSDTMESGRGFLGVFANFQLVLINLQSSVIEAHERVVLGTTYSSARAEDRTVWNALDQTQKTRALASLMKRGIESKLPGMLGSPKQ